MERFYSEDIETAKAEEMVDLLGNDSDEEVEINLSPRSPSVSSSTASHAPQDDKVSRIRTQIQEVTSTMQDNVKKILQRGECLEDLNEAAIRLNTTSVDFSIAASRARRQAWLNQFKSRIFLGAAVFLIIMCILVPVLIRHSSPSSEQETETKPSP